MTILGIILGILGLLGIPLLISLVYFVVDKLPKIKKQIRAKRKALNN